jgi:hypothetical protein
LLYFFQRCISAGRVEKGKKLVAEKWFFI